MTSPRMDRLTELASFGAVGGIAFVVDLGVYNLLRFTLLDEHPIGAKVVSVAVATAVAWMGNRHLTFRRTRSRPAAREALLFAVSNVIGLAIAAGCLFVSHYVLGFTSTLADNVAGNGVGLVLGTAFRYAAYRFVVFRPERVDVRHRMTLPDAPVRADEPYAPESHAHEFDAPQPRTHALAPEGAQ